MTRLAAKASQHHSAVTLYEAPEDPDELADSSKAGPSKPRRTKRVKDETDALEAGDSPKIEPMVTPLRRRKRAKTTDDAIEADGAADSSADPPATTRKRSKKVAAHSSTSSPACAPARWEDAYAAIKDMRARVVAPVDTMGCDRAQLREADPKNQRFATLVSLMLSSQTKDEVTDAAVNKLRVALGGSLSVQAVLEADDALVSEAIAKVGFWRRKTQYIKQTAQRLYDDFDSDVPKTVDELCSLPGVGPKMAYLALQVAWKLNLGIGVDVHVHRITNRLGWHVRPTKNPEQTRLGLESWLPKELHGEINHLLVGFGQTICLPVNPKCGECTLSTMGLCPSASIKTSSRSPKKAKVGEKMSRPGSASPLGGKEEKGDIRKDENLGSGPKIKIEIESEVSGNREI